MSFKNCQFILVHMTCARGANAVLLAELKHPFVHFTAPRQIHKVPIFETFKKAQNGKLEVHLRPYKIELLCGIRDSSLHRRELSSGERLL